MYQWNWKWKLCFNAIKCKALTLCRSQTPLIFQYKLTAAKLDRVNSNKNLEFQITNYVHFTAERTVGTRVDGMPSLF